jgi:hypothetical protein
MKTSAIQTNEALEKFQRTVELLSKNKVNKTNAFENRLIDEIENLFTDWKTITEEDRWVYYSSVIDTCGRIYGYCVDHLHEETFRILGNVNRTAENDPNSEEKPPILYKKFTSLGINTLENCEILINMKDLDKLKSPTCLISVNRTSDSARMSTLIMNNANVNGSIELVIDVDDLVVGSHDLPAAAEVNLEGIVNFSEYQLLDIEISEKLLQYEKKIDVKTSEFKQVWENINENIEESVKSDSASYDEEEFEKEVLVRPSLGFDERISQEFSLDFIQSSDKLIFSKDFLAAGVTSRPKKRKRKESQKIENEMEPLCLLQIEDFEELDEITANLSLEEKRKNLEDKNFEGLERGYKEKKLGELFTRHGKTIVVSCFQQEDRHVVHDPLCLQELEYPWKPQNDPRPQGKPDLNIKALKETIKQIIDVNPEGNFVQIVKAVEGDLKDKLVEKVSISACFVTLLHLANEHCLRLQQTDISNFLVRSKRDSF